MTQWITALCKSFKPAQIPYSVPAVIHFFSWNHLKWHRSWDFEGLLNVFHCFFLLALPPFQHNFTMKVFCTVQWVVKKTRKAMSFKKLKQRNGSLLIYLLCFTTIAEYAEYELRVLKTNKRKLLYIWNQPENIRKIEMKIKL